MKFTATFLKAATPKQTVRLIARLHKLEEVAKTAQLRIWAIESQWTPLYEQVKNTPEWEADCAATGASKRYNFRDVLA